MATLWGSVYSQVCDVLLEGNPGLSLGLLTDQQFYSLAAEVLVDFTSKAGIIRRLFNTQTSFGVQAYQQDSLMGELLGCSFADTFIYESSDFQLSNTDRDIFGFWNIGNPATYKQDSLPTKMTQIEPAPQLNGNDVSIPFGGSGYGTIASVAAYTDFTFAADPSTPAGYGTVAGANGNPYVEALNPGFGLIAAMVPSTNNLTMQGTVLPYQLSGLTAQTYIELVPDSLVPYLKWGILARVFGQSDSELKDSQKGQFCASMYQIGINTANAIMCDVYQED